ncbi:hypothetical protein SAMN06297358_0526 [Pedobacter xixiisoli]|uniref:Uncharacterized protein n=1 Tax=Pedobacter xixiisoli TaxID=1476464 RepID=A0A285ZR60_9SPHI|nr:hypothetical protein SAMN06297358_0526 [Pedobacter xixiisoli]
MFKKGIEPPLKGILLLLVVAKISVLNAYTNILSRFY